MSNKFLTGIVLDEECLLTLDELSRACAVQADWIIKLVDEGVLEPRGSDVSHWVFSGISLHRARTARRLQQDLGINVAGAALALDLMEEIEDLRAHLCVLEREDQ